MSAVQNEIQTLLDRVVEEGRECGIQVAAYHHGALVVDAWAGRCDARRDTPVDGRTLFPVFSTTKGVAATVIHILAARGVFKYDDPIALYWPEFAQHGKEAITLRHVLTHSSGIPQLPADLSLEDAADWDRMCAIVAALPPLWRPGSKMEYHALTYGWILGEVARRATGTPFGELLDALVRTPLKLADLYIGCPAAVCARVAVLDEPTAAPLLPNESGHYTIPPALQPLYVWMNRPDAQRACNPAGSGVMSAQSIARHYAALVPGGVDGVSLLPETHVTAVTELKPAQACTPAEIAIRRALGYSNGGPDCIFGTRSSAFGHGGYGGSVGFADPQYAFACGVTKNLFSGRGAERELVTAIRMKLGIPE